MGNKSDSVGSKPRYRCQVGGCRDKDIYFDSILDYFKHILDEHGLHYLEERTKTKPYTDIGEFKEGMTNRKKKQLEKAKKIITGKDIYKGSLAQTGNF